MACATYFQRRFAAVRICYSLTLHYIYHDSCLIWPVLSERLYLGQLPVHDFTGLHCDEFNQCRLPLVIPIEPA